MIEFYCDVLGMRVTDRLGDEGDVAAHQRRPPHAGARRQGLRPLSPPGLRADRLGRAAGRARSPGPARPLAGLGAGAPRPGPQPGGLRADPRGGVLRRAVQRHGAARARPRAARLARRRAIPPTPGASCRRAPTSASTRRRWRPSARGSRRSDIPYRRRRQLMTLTGVREATGARTGEQFLEGLRQGGREIWLRGEQISHPLDHPELRAAALSMARVFDIQHEHADEMLAPVARRSRPPGQRHPSDPAHDRGSDAAPAGVRAGGGGVGRDDGAHAGLPQRDLRLLRRTRRRVGAPRQRAGRREPRRLPGLHARPRPVDDARAR